MPERPHRPRRKLHWRRRLVPWPAAFAFWVGASLAGWLLVWGLVEGLGTDEPPIALEQGAMEDVELAPASGPDDDGG